MNSVIFAFTAHGRETALRIQGILSRCGDAAKIHVPAKFANETCAAYEGPLPEFTGSYADWAQTLIYLCEMTFAIAMTVGSVKGAQSLTSKAFGL